MGNLHKFKANLLRALAQPHRLAILDQYSLAQTPSLEPSNVSHQPSSMHLRGFVARHKERTVDYYLTLEVYTFLDLGRQVIQRQVHRQPDLLQEGL